MPASSREHQLCRLRVGIESENLFAFSIQQELNGLLEVVEALFLSLALAIRAGNFQARRPKTAFGRLTPVNDGCEVFHAPNCSSSCRGRKMAFISPDAVIWRGPACDAGSDPDIRIECETASDH